MKLTDSQQRILVDTLHGGATRAILTRAEWDAYLADVAELAELGLVWRRGLFFGLTQLGATIAANITLTPAPAH